MQKSTASDLHRYRIATAIATGKKEKIQSMLVFVLYKVDVPCIYLNLPTAISARCSCPASPAIGSHQTCSSLASVAVEGSPHSRCRCYPRGWPAAVPVAAAAAVQGSCSSLDSAAAAEAAQPAGREVANHTALRKLRGQTAAAEAVAVAGAALLAEAALDDVAVLAAVPAAAAAAAIVVVVVADAATAAAAATKPFAVADSLAIAGLLEAVAAAAVAVDHAGPSIEQQRSTSATAAACLDPETQEYYSASQGTLPANSTHSADSFHWPLVLLSRCHYHFLCSHSSSSA